jgi:hypothetical protein
VGAVPMTADRAAPQLGSSGLSTFRNYVDRVDLAGLTISRQRRIGR